MDVGNKNIFNPYPANYDEDAALAFALAESVKDSKETEEKGEKKAEVVPTDDKSVPVENKEEDPSIKRRKIEEIKVEAVIQDWRKKPVTPEDKVAIAAFKTPVTLLLRFKKNGQELVEKINQINIESLSTLGDVEKKAHEIIDAVETKEKKRKKAHDRVVKYLKIWGEQDIQALIALASAKIFK